jgi:predicted acylesterase/phospholipase RssA
MKKINIGMTFYGGVSLAVYEAGVAEEFLRFVQFCKNAGRKYLEPDQSDINIRVISGSSAGGLAAVLMSAALVNSDDPSRHIREMRRIWFDIADLSNIQYKRGQNVLSLLNNDILEEEVEEFLKIREGGKGLSADVRILITATNMQGFFDAIPVEHDFTKISAYAERVFPTTRHTEVFEFTGCDIRDASAEQGKEIRKKITKAARITSTFPAAFPPQLVQSPSFSEKTLKWYEDGKKKDDKPLHFWYFDGGVLDNKPLGHAIDHMQTSSEEGMWLYFFIEPKPRDYEKKHKEWGMDPMNPPDPAATVMAVLDTRGEETIYYDLRHIQAINHQVMQINSLVSDLCTLLPGCPKLSQQFLNDCEENIKTARLHRFLPDYLKCVTMMRYAFLRKGKLDKDKENIIKEFSRFVFEKIRPLDLLGTIGEVARQKFITKNTLPDSQKILKKDAELRDALKEFEVAATKVRDAQLLFRQITFWVEYNRKKDDKLSDGTWNRFNDARKELEGSLAVLDEWYMRVEERIKALIDGDELFRTLKCYMLMNEAVHSAAGVETREKIDVVRIYHNEKDYGPLAGAKIANFAGFLDKRWRKHDYLMGIKDAREMLRGRMNEYIANDSFWEEYEAWRLDIEGKERDTKYSLSEKDILQRKDMELENLAADKVVCNLNGILNSSEKLVRKHDDKLFYLLLKKIKVDWVLKITRFVLWILKQATCQPSIADNKKETTVAISINNFVGSGRRYIGFILIGIILGLLISFFLPDFVKDFTHWIWEKLRYLLSK